MKILYDVMNRRMFIKLASGGLAAIPFLDSLVKEAFAQGSQNGVTNYIQIVWNHSIWNEAQPQELRGNPNNISIQPQNTYLIDPNTGHQMREYNFNQFSTTAVAQGYTRQNPGAVSDIFSVIPASERQHIIYTYLANGFHGHGFGPNIGAMSESHFNAQEVGQYGRALANASIDTIIAKNQSGVNPLANSGQTSPTLEHCVLNVQGGASYGYQGTEIVANSRVAHDLNRLHELLFPNAGSNSGSSLTQRQQRKLTVVQQAIQSISEIISPGQLGSKMSSQDRQVAQAYQNHLGSIENSLQSSSAGCSAPAFTNMQIDDTWNQGNQTIVDNFWGQAFDLIVAAQACGINRVAALSFAIHTDYTGGSYHHHIAHADIGEQNAYPHFVNVQRSYLRLYAMLVKKVQDAGMLNRTLIVAIPELGARNHDSIEHDVFIAGGGNAGGRFLDPRKYHGHRYHNPNMFHGLLFTHLHHYITKRVLIQGHGLNPDFSNFVAPYNRVVTGWDYRTIAGWEQHQGWSYPGPFYPRPDDPSHTDYVLNLASQGNHNPIPGLVI